MEHAGACRLNLLLCVFGLLSAIQPMLAAPVTTFAIFLWLQSQMPSEACLGNQ